MLLSIHNPKSAIKCPQERIKMSETVDQLPEPAPPHTVPPQPDQTPVEEPARFGPLARLTGTLLSPGETFADVSRKPTWIAPMIIGIITVLAATFFFQWRVHPDWDSIFRAQIQKQMAGSSQSLTDEQIEQRVSISKSIAKFSPIIAAVFTPIFYVILAGIFALGLMFIQAKTTFKKILSVVAWSRAAIGVVETVVMMASLMIRDEESLKTIDPTQPSGIVPTNVAAFLPSETSPIVKAVAGSLDIFTIWTLILLTIGFAAIAGSRKITTQKTATVVFGIWVIFVLLKVVWAALFG
jgi:Yip1-like protein